MESGLGCLFKDENLILIIDGLSKRYGILPYDIVSGQTLHQFNFNIAIMLMAMGIERKMLENPEKSEETTKLQSRKSTFKDFGLKRTVIKEQHGSAK